VTTERPRRRRWWAISALLFLGLLTTGAIVLALRIPYSADGLRARVVSTLADRLDAEVELGRLELHVAPRLRIAGEQLLVSHKGRRDVPPLISVNAFSVGADVLGLWNRHVSSVALTGLAIHIPPDDDADTPAEARDDVARLPAGGDVERVGPGRQVVVDVVHAPDARLVVLRRDPSKPPRVWQMHDLRVESVGAHTAMPFESRLTNAVPPGTIETTGVFGPWHRANPGRTPVDGEFVFHDADLGVFKGISGRLSAHGTYGGTLERLDVRGETETPDFTVQVSGQPVSLKTKYHAIVDGTNGNTTLEQIDAAFLDTALVAKGGVYEVEGVKGREVKLAITMDRARIEDVMRLAVRTAKPPMLGALTLNTDFLLPPGDKDVVDKLRLDGRFSIKAGRFTDPEVQQKINEMSVRASGRLKQLLQADRRSSEGGAEGVGTTGGRPPNVVSDFEGRFRLADGTLHVPAVAFDIPGAAVRLSGRYRLDSETLSFAGNLYMDAKVSQTVSGWKSWLLRIADPLFRKNGRTVVPLKISGTRSKPRFSVDFGRVF
jgi:hypothetical protein